MAGMRLLKFQDTYVRQIQLLGFMLMVLIPCITAVHQLGETEGEKTYNLRIGFDLTRGSQGASSLRIRNFDDNDEEEQPQPSFRASSAVSEPRSSSSREHEKKKKVPKMAVEMKAAEDSAQLDDDSNESVNRQRSTKGLRADEYEPQGPEVREVFDKDSDSENSN